MKDFLNKAVGSNGSIPMDPPDSIKDIIRRAEEAREGMLNAKTDEEREEIGDQVLEMLLSEVKKVMETVPSQVRVMLQMVTETQRKLSMLDCKRAGHPEIPLRKLIDM